MIKRWLLSFLFEKLPLIKLLNGKKRLVGNILLFSGVVVGALAKYFPEIPNIEQINAEALLYIGAIFDVIGDEHAKVKDEA